MSRPLLIERADYTPALAVEQFIVPLLRDRILQTIPPLGPSTRVLDVGCGRQPFREYFESRGCTYTSTDAQDPLGIVDYVAEIDGELPEALVASPFDFVFCTEVLEHVADWDKAFRNFSALITAGGQLLVTCPHMYILHEVPYDFWRPTIYGLSFYARRWGFEPVSVEMAGSSWDVLGTVLGANLGSARAIERTLFNRSLVFMVDLIAKLGFKALSTRFLQRRIAWGNQRYPIYMSNVALFRRVLSGSET
jgi:SAM-dependent methyltransferase